MSLVGHPIRYLVPDEHRTATVKGKRTDDKGQEHDIVLQGSVHHAERTEFAGQITHTVKDGKREIHDIVIFAHGKAAPIHLQGVTEGDGPGMLTLVK